MAPRNPEQEKEILDWIEAVMEAPLPEGDFAEVLKNGVVLCKLMNKIKPDSVKKFKEKVGISEIIYFVLALYCYFVWLPGQGSLRVMVPVLGPVLKHVLRHVPEHLLEHGSALQLGHRNNVRQLVVHCG